MKKLLIVSLTLILSIALFGCNNTEGVQEQETKSERFKQKIIIMDSVNDPLPPEAKNVQSMPSKSEPQQIPNVNLNAPIIITKMSYSDKENSN